MKKIAFFFILFIFSCTKDEEPPSLISFVGDYDKLIIKEVKSMGGGGSDTIFETISLSQVNDSIYNYKISNTQVNHDIIYYRKIDEYHFYKSRYSNSNYTAFEYYEFNDSLYVFTRIGGLGQWTEYKTSIKL